VRASLKKTDALLEEARGIAVNARAATTDLDVLRSEVEASLRRVSGLIEEVNRKWPFARERQLELP
jgi:phospholipid/cholesterol/gamma-HCH transport system substrate-binding protein